MIAPKFAFKRILFTLAFKTLPSGALSFLIVYLARHFLDSHGVAVPGLFYAGAAVILFGMAFRLTAGPIVQQLMGDGESQ